MRTIFLTIVLFCLFGVWYPAYTQDMSLKDFNLRGNVKSVKEVSYTGKLTAKGYEKVEKGWGSNWMRDSKMEFDKSGNLIRETYIEQDGSISRTDKFVYKDNKIVSSEMLYHTRLYTYDETGNLISMKEYNRQQVSVSASNANVQGDEKVSLYKFIYDESGKLIKKSEHDFMGREIGETNYLYNTNGHLLSEVTDYEDYTESHKYTYDEAGNLIEVVWEDSDDGIIEKVIYAYDGKNKISESCMFYQDGGYIGKLTYVFENGEVVITEEADENDKLVAKWECNYHYSEEGNWTRKIIIVNGYEVFIVEREIEYY